MSLRLGCIADDYTGASDLANTLTRQGMRTVQTIGVPPAGFDLPEVDAVVIALKIRSVAADQAVTQALAAYRWLHAHGAAHVMYKICSTFDSTDAGNIGPITQALAEACTSGSGPVVTVPVTPAFPETGRSVFQGHLFVGNLPLHESPLKDHPLNPMHDSNLVRVLAAQSRGSIGLIDLAIVERGAAAITAALDSSGNRAMIVDAVAERHLLALGEAAFPRPVSTGASGLGLGLARAAMAHLPPVARATAFAVPHIAGPAAIIAGSCSAATLEQIAAIESKIPVRHLDAETLLHPDGLAEPLEWARTHLANGPILLASSADPQIVSRLKATHGATLGEAIEARLATLASHLVDLGVRRLIVAGGETSGAIIDRLGITALAIGPEIAPGVPLLRCIDGEPRLFVLKSGNFGGKDFFALALAAMGVASS